MKTEDALREWGDYQGRQDKPDDFDDFWDKAKKRWIRWGFIMN